MTTEIERLLPQDLDAERSLLGSLLIDPNAYALIEGRIEPDDFYREQHRAIFEAVARVVESGEKVDVVTVGHELRGQGTDDLAGGPPYLADIMNAVPTAFHIESYAGIVEQAASLRRVISAATQMAGAAYRRGAQADEVMETAEQLLFQIASRGDVSQPRPLLELLAELQASIMERRETGALRGIPSGVPALDRVTGGFQKSDLIVLAARTSVGKTSFALQIARQAALHQDGPKAVGLFSLEMPSSEITQRIVASQANVDFTRLRDGLLSDSQLETTVRTLASLEGVRMVVDDTPSIPIGQLRSKARRMAIEHEVELLIVDYLQLIQVPGTTETRAQEVATITRSLKTLARELDVPIVACAQLSRAIEQRDSPRPRLSDLRESGSIEQDADLVLFLHYPQHDDPLDKPVREVTLTLAKHRNGPLAEVDLMFIRPRGHFGERQAADL